MALAISVAAAISKSKSGSYIKVITDCHLVACGLKNLLDQFTSDIDARLFPENPMSLES
jgi:hypothetical protein